MPILVPALDQVDEVVIAETDLEFTNQSVEETSEALADLGRAAWEAWLADHSKDVEYTSLRIPVHIEGEGDLQEIVVDGGYLRSQLGNISEANVAKIIQAVEYMPEWRQALVHGGKSAYIEEITGLSLDGDLVEIESIEASGGDKFNVGLTYPDPIDVIKYQVDQAVASFGTDKIWGSVSRETVENKARKVTAIPASVAAAVQASVRVEVTAPEKGEYSPRQTPVENLVLQATLYTVTIEEGSFTPAQGVEQAWEAAIDEAMETLKALVIPEQTRPGTSVLLSQPSGQSVTIETGTGGDRHVTFFVWGTNTAAVSVFIKSGGRITVRVPIGSYRLVYASGDEWYGQKYSFGPRGHYGEFKETRTSSAPMKINIEPRYEYTVSIAVSSTGDSVPSGTTTNPYET